MHRQSQVTFSHHDKNGLSDPALLDKKGLSGRIPRKAGGITATFLFLQLHSLFFFSGQVMSLQKAGGDILPLQDTIMDGVEQDKSP
jgi:hypothetical protein